MQRLTFVPPGPNFAAFRLVQVSLVAWSGFLPLHGRSWGAQWFSAILVSQAVLAGIWLGFGPGRFHVRLVGAALWLFCAAYLKSLIEARPEELDVFLFLAVIAAVVAVILAVIRLALRIRLETPHAAAGTRPFQYKLQHLIILMLVSSLALGVGRLLIPLFPNFRLRDAYLIGVVCVGWACITLPMTFVILGSHTRRQVFGGGLVAVAVTVGIAGGLYLLLHSISGVNVPDILSIGALATGLTALGLILQRRQGVRLVRSPLGASAQRIAP